MESFENQIWIVCSEITTIAFWHGETTFSIPNAHSQGAEEPEEPPLFLPQDEGRTNIPLGCSNPTGSTVAKQHQAIRSGP